MKHLHQVFLLFALLAATFLTSCDDGEELAMSQIQTVTEEYFMQCVEGKGWRYVESHELKDGSTLVKRDYWESRMGGEPVHYAFNGDSITSFVYIDAYPIHGYRTAKFTFDETTNGIIANGVEVFKVAFVTPNELRIIRREGSHGDGTRAYSYAVYRAVTGNELASLRQTYRYDFDSLAEEYPELPEQETVTAADFTTYAVGQTWKCVAAHRVEAAGRYSAADFYAGRERISPLDYAISNDTIITLRHAVNGVADTLSATKYDYRANGFYITTDAGWSFRLLSLTPNEMKMIRRTTTADGCEQATLYCVYRRTAATERSTAIPNVVNGS